MKFENIKTNNKKGANNSFSAMLWTLNNKRYFRGWRKRLIRNRLVIYIILFSISLEIPFRRFVFKEWRSILLAWCRLISVIWVLSKLSIHLILSECEYAQWRAYLYDWTIYYPATQRKGIMRSYICMLMFHLILKFSVFYHKRKAFDTSLIDFLCSEPPHSSPKHSDHHSLSFYLNGQQHLTERFPLRANRVNLSKNRHTTYTKSSFNAIDMEASGAPRMRHVLHGENGNYLRDRVHWFRLSDILWTKSTKSTIFILILCALVIFQANRRLGFILIQRGRTCDIEMPFLRLLGLLELNYFLLECTNTLVGSFSYCSMVKSDLMLQAQRVENCLFKLLASVEGHERPSSSDFAPVHIRTKDSKQAQTLSGDPRRAILGQDDSLLNQLVTQPKLLERRRLDSLRLRARHTALLPDIHCQQDQTATTNTRQSDSDATSNSDKLVILNTRNETIIYAEDFELNCMELTSAIEPESIFINKAADSSTMCMEEAQSKVIMFLGSIDRHKQAISFIGNAFLFFMIVSLSFIPLLIISYRSSRRLRPGDYVYVLTGLISFSSGLIFAHFGACVHQRTMTLGRLVYRISSANHSRHIASRWNKILMIWYCPNRCAFKVSGIIELTYLNMLKAISFFISGITLVINYLGN